MGNKVNCPVCNVLFDARGLRMHKDSEACKQQAKKVANRGSANKGSIEKPTNECSCTNKRLLRTDVWQEYEAKTKYGYSDVCDDCGKLFE